MDGLGSVLSELTLAAAYLMLTEANDETNGPSCLRFVRDYEAMRAKINQQAFKNN